MQTRPKYLLALAVRAACGVFVAVSCSLAWSQSIDPAKLRGTVIDEEAAIYEGEWVASTSSKPFVGKGYHHDDNKDKGGKSATFTARVPEDGHYHVLFGYTPGGNRASNAPVTVHAADGPKTINVNQKQSPPLAGFVDLGEFELKADQDAVIVVSNEGSDGYVIVDAVQIVDPVEFKLVQEDANKPVKVAKNNDEKQQKKPAPKPAVKFERVAASDAAKLTPERLDEMLSEHLGDMDEAPLVGDEMFLRRAALDIAGRQPTVEELEAFLADDSPEKRAAAVDRLLASADYGRNWANYWSDVIAWRQEEPQLTFHDYTPFKSWLADEFNGDRGWDETVFRMLTATGKVGDNPAGTFIAFHQANERKLAGETSRVFLSVQIACAECHDHPFVDMPMETFHGMAAFFVRTEAKIPWNESSKIELKSKDKGEHKIPGKKGEMKPVALTGVDGGMEMQQEAGLPDLQRRSKLAEWIVHPENPYFARSHVNRVFARLMGRGFYEPVDDLGDTADDPVLPEVHEALAEHFIAHQFDQKEVIRLLANTRAYQRSIAAPDSADEKPLAAAVPKKLRGDEVFDSLVTAIALPNIQPEQAKPTGAIRFPIPPKNTRDLVNDAFGYDPSFKDELLVRTMKQAMFMMNNVQLQKQIDSRPDSGTYLSKLLGEEQDNQKVATRLYRAVLARSPSEKELGIVMAHVNQVDDRGAAFEDVLWSLINSAEFTTRR